MIICTSNGGAVEPIVAADSENDSISVVLQGDYQLPFQSATLTELGCWTLMMYRDSSIHLV